MKTITQICYELEVHLSPKELSHVEKAATKMFNNGGGKWEECVEIIIMQMGR